MQNTLNIPLEDWKFETNRLLVNNNNVTYGEYRGGGCWNSLDHKSMLLKSEYLEDSFPADITVIITNCPLLYYIAQNPRCIVKLLYENNWNR
jgi:hypothetical protein